MSKHIDCECGLKNSEPVFCDLHEAASQMLAALKAVVDVIHPSNPQDPALDGFERCPRDHINCCGVCEIYYQVLDAIDAAEGRKR